MLPPLICPKCRLFRQGRMACPHPGCGHVTRGLDGSRKKRVLAQIDGIAFSGRPVIVDVPTGSSTGPWLVLGYEEQEGRGGGVLVIDLLQEVVTQRIEVQARVRQVSRVGQREVVFGDAEGRVHVADVATGGLRSSERALHGEIVAAPLVLDEATAFVATGRGAVAQVDLRQLSFHHDCQIPSIRGSIRIEGDPVADPRNHGILFGTVEDNGLQGRLIRYHRRRGDIEVLLTRQSALYASPLPLEGGREALLALYGRHGGPSGIDRCSLERRGGDPAPLPYPTAQPVRATPTLDAGKVYFPDHDHLLHALDVQTLKPEWPQPLKWSSSIVTSPLVLDREGLLVFGDNQGHVVGVDLEAGSEVWSLQLPQAGAGGRTPRALALGGFAAKDEQVYFGTSSGQVLALPACHVKIDWAVDRARRLKQDRRAAALLLMGSGPEGPHPSVVKKAADILRGAREYEVAAPLLEHVEEFTEAADAYRHARCWDDAIRLYEAIGDPQAARQCRIDKAEAEGLPVLEARCIDHKPPRLQRDAKAQVTLEISNVALSKAKARGLRLDVSGPFGSVAPLQCRELTVGRPWRVELRDLRPEDHGPLSLVLDPSVEAEDGRRGRLPAIEIELMVYDAPQRPINYHVNVEAIHKQVQSEVRVSAGGDQGYVTVNTHLPEASGPGPSATGSGQPPAPGPGSSRIKAGRSIGSAVAKGGGEVHIEAGEDIGYAEIQNPVQAPPGTEPPAAG